MELRHVEAFIVVAEELHFGRAAERMMLAQPAVSQRIRQLESDLGVQLFERSTRSVRLTDSGEAMLAESRVLLEQVERTRSAARAAGRGDAGIVRIGYGGTTHNAAIPRIVAAMRERFPGIDLKLESNLLTGAVFDKVADREIDIGFGRLPGSRSGVKTEVIDTEHLVVALPAGHRLADKRVLRFADLKDESFVAPTAGSGSSVRNLVMHAAMRSNIVPRVEFEAPDSLTIVSLVAAGLGVTVTLSSLMVYQPRGVVFRDLKEKTEVESVLIWHERNTSRPVHAVLRLITEQIAANGGFLERPEINR